MTTTGIPRMSTFEGSSSFSFVPRILATEADLGPKIAALSSVQSAPPAPVDMQRSVDALFPMLLVALDAVAELGDRSDPADRR